MEDSTDAATGTVRTPLTSFPRTIASSPSSSSANSSQPPPVSFAPCAACRALRRRCTAACLLAPYFAADDSHRFSIAHRVFGASNIVKFLQEIPRNRRAEAVESMVYEASARLRDPVYGCAGHIFRLQREVRELQAAVARSQANCAILRAQQANLLSAAVGCIEGPRQPQRPPPPLPCPEKQAAASSLKYRNAYFTGGGGICS